MFYDFDLPPSSDVIILYFLKPAYGPVGDREKCLETGMDDYIGKPVAIKELADVLSRCPIHQD